MQLGSLQGDRGRLGPSYLGKFKLVDARATADDKFTSLLHHLEKCF